MVLHSALAALRERTDMSKISDMLRCVQMRRQKDIPSRIKVTEHYIPSVSIERLVEYRCTVEFAYGGFAPQGNEGAIASIVKQARRALVYEVFGEFLPIIIDLNEALYDYDFDKSHDILTKLERQMFGDEP
jgi:hypothetical protein